MLYISVRPFEGRVAVFSSLARVGNGGVEWGNPSTQHSTSPRMKKHLEGLVNGLFSPLFRGPIYAINYGINCGRYTDL